MSGLTQKEAAAVCGVTVRQFVRYRRRYQWLQPVALTGLVPVFTPEDVDKLRGEVLRDKLSVLAALSARRRGPRPKPAHVVTMGQLRAARRKAGQ